MQEEPFPAVLGFGSSSVKVRDQTCALLSPSSPLMRAEESYEGRSGEQDEKALTDTSARFCKF